MLRLSICIVCLALAAQLQVSAQQAPPTENKPKVYESYEKLFDDFDKRRGVLITRYERLQEAERVEPAELQRVEGQMKDLDKEYTAALRAFVDANPNSRDAMPARFEIAVTFSRLEDDLDKAVLAANEFIEKHADSELVPDARFLKAQTLFRIAGREADALAALEAFIEEHPEREDVPACRMMRVRALLFLNRVDDAKRSLRVLLDSESVKDDEDAEEFLKTQLNNLDWVGRELPDFELAAIGGDKVSRAEFAGKPILLTFYDSTSPACLGELPFIQEAHKRFGEKLNFLGVSVNESRTAFEQWLERNNDKVKFKNVWIAREAENTLVRKLSVSLIPFNVLVDRDGKIYRYDVRSDDMLRYAELLTK
jgi:peroxiredoxin/TolA-binding protein